MTRAALQRASEARRAGPDRSGATSALAPPAPPRRRPQDALVVRQMIHRRTIATRGHRRRGGAPAGPERSTPSAEQLARREEFSAIGAQVPGRNRSLHVAR